jgi:hypothetical protein
LAGQASCTTTFSSEGSHTIEALYSGDANFGASDATLVQQVDDHTTVTGNANCNTGSIALTNPDINSPEIGASPYPSRIFVAGLGAVAHLSVTLHSVTNSDSHDIDGLLVGPEGQSWLRPTPSPCPRGQQRQRGGGQLHRDQHPGRRLPDGVAATGRPPSTSSGPRARPRAISCHRV